DVIRDKLVTGVQTCALPISPAGPIAARISRLRRRITALRSGSRDTVRPVANAVAELKDIELSEIEAAVGTRSFSRGRSYARGNRSEERRVGKEGRAGGERTQ